MSDLQPRIIANTASDSLDFVDPFEPGSSSDNRYSANELIGDIKDEGMTLKELDFRNSKPIIPTPLSVSQLSTAGDKPVRLGSHWTVDYVGGMREEAMYLAGKASGNAIFGEVPTR